MPYYIKNEKKGGARGMVAKLDKVFSEYIRLRDSRAFGFKAFKCISCGQIKPYAMADCGHYYSRRHMGTRWDEDNAHSECRFCNRFNAEHLEYYREHLIKKIGQQRFDLLRVKSNNVCKYSAFELEELYKLYKGKADKLKKER